MTSALNTFGPARRFDAIAMEIFTNRLLSITENMAINMMRASFSTQIKERRDFSVGLFDARGRLLAQGTHIPLHLGSLMGSMQAVLEACPVSEMVEGDAFICNDPYLAGGTHLPDISVVTPIFIDGAVRLFAANIGHHSDVGGAVPGSTSAKSATIFAEGIRIPAMRIVRGGKVDHELIRLIATNSRLPEERQLDLNVQVAVNLKGGAAAKNLFIKMGLDEVDRAIDDVLDYTNRRLRRRISGLKHGRYTFSTQLDDDGNGGDPVPIKVTVTVTDDQLHFDLDGTGPQARGALNVSTSALRATVYYSVKALLDPELMPNSGMFEAITIEAPKGSIANPIHPAACGARSITCQKIAGAVFGAFRGLLPENRIIASGNDVLPSINFSGTRAGSQNLYVCGEALGGGAGAKADRDGMDGVHVHVTNSLNLPTEALENEFPLLVEEYGLVNDSGGAGRHRGGLGIARQIRVFQDGTIFSARSDSHKKGAEGALGGLEGGRGTLTRNPGREDQEVLPSKVAHIILKAGDSMRLETPGGGGFGLPAERPTAELAKDLRDGVISEGAAMRDYGKEKTEEALHSLQCT
ncbi:N-methylhydantoinase B [Rhizobium sp. BK077]|uniref:hydantoinase B/oxoprolinase family protein n=1 Tax=unclassified Rhizobium TaxID=2613769 RepID=UPI0016128D04|nr:MULTISPECIES: hydantoinase B/oxoprolinase family protein [unclassified Rhizobium]MBB3303413.1 N-methylhydantoinase B [Rhizobium sp. BK112]MBB3372519.1 N-methylhydantoinase B [Rhizobium sp. BK077]MBB4183291.1 N-methylhydantoinase B [Rhizobium sp. BK109]MBB4255967.1 N-methylhydantoinase B [Rhizobium sp. BK008]